MPMPWFRVIVVITFCLTLIMLWIQFPPLRISIQHAAVELADDLSTGRATLDNPAAIVVEFIHDVCPIGPIVLHPNTHDPAVASSA